MKQILKKVLPVLGLLFSLAFTLSPLLVSAQGFESGLNQVRSGNAELVGGRLTASQTPIELIANIIRIMLTIAAALAVMFIIIGGYQYITSAGNEEAAEKGRGTMTNALMGIALIILSYVLVTVTFNLVSRNRV